MKILDCTLRDGGYYNNWDFDFTKARELIMALNESGVDIIEVGYKSCDNSGFGGLFKYCNESMLQYLKDYTHSEYAFMIDIKEFMVGDQVNLTALDQCVQPTNISVFSWVRLASHFSTLHAVPEFINYFKEKGYQICFNLMGGSLLSDDQILEAIGTVNDNPPEVFYIADSFGSFYEEDIKRLIKLIKAAFKGKIGIHTHDNQGMAFANTLAAIEAGVDFVDGTVTGMGRGAGNLAIEQFLQKFADVDGSGKYKPNALLEIINSYILPLKNQYQWGFNYVYMLSGLKNIHPTYCQNLSEGNRYTISQMSDILERIPAENRAKYNKKVLQEAIKEVLENQAPATDTITLPDNFSYNAKAVLIVAKGSSVVNHQLALELFVREKNLLIIECNDTGYFQGWDNRIISILNEVKLNHYLEKHKEDHLPIITGQNSINKNHSHTNVFHQSFHLGRFRLNEDKSITIPDYDAGFYAIGLAVKYGATSIYLAGFDGFDEEERNKLVDGHFKEIMEEMKVLNIEMEAITPTVYQHLNKTSVYAYLP